MTQVIIYTNEDGGVTTCYPSGEIPIDAVMEKDIPKNTNARIVDFESLPHHYDEFYDAWEMTDIEVVINKAKAVELTKQRLRYERESLLVAQDVLFQRALETGADTTAIVAEKNRLRNITDLATVDKTLEELQALNCSL